jgi:proteasome component ECM29
VFPANHVASRFILLLGAGDSNDDIRRASISKLYSALSKAREKSKQARSQKPDSEPEPLPDFVQMLQLVLDKANLRLKTQQKVTVGSTVLAFQPKKYEEILNFLRMCLIHSAGVHLPDRDELNFPQNSAPKVSKYLLQLSQSPANSVSLFAEFAEKLLSASSGLAQTQCLLHLVGCAPFIAKNYFGRLNW